MKIFVSHSTRFDFNNDLYNPIRESKLVEKHAFFFPHETDTVSNTKNTIQETCDIVLAEVSHPSTGQGIELGWAEDVKKKIICIYKEGKEYSSSLKAIANTFIEYKNNVDLIKKLETIFKT